MHRTAYCKTRWSVIFGDSTSCYYSSGCSLPHGGPGLAVLLRALVQGAPVVGHGGEAAQVPVPGLQVRGVPLRERARHVVDQVRVPPRQGGY